MNGYVDHAGRALVRMGIKPSETATTVKIDAWVDTGFTGELVLPQERITALRLTRSAVVKAELGDGSETVLDTYTCWIEWEGEVKQIEVLAANVGKFPLLGVGLLRDCTVTIDSASRVLTIV